MSYTIGGIIYGVVAEAEVNMDIIWAHCSKAAKKNLATHSFVIKKFADPKIVYHTVNIDKVSCGRCGMPTFIIGYDKNFPDHYQHPIYHCYEADERYTCDQLMIKYVLR
jgi:hypothetical protein